MAKRRDVLDREVHCPDFGAAIDPGELVADRVRFLHGTRHGTCVRVLSVVGRLLVWVFNSRYVRDD